MLQVTTYKECPGCKNNSIGFELETKDYTVSQKKFAIWQCHHCSLRFTQDAPVAGDIGAFYQSNNYISHSDTKQGFINKLYHSVRNITLKQKQKLIQKSTGLRTGHLLDVGAGTGAFANGMKTAGWNVTALEPDETARITAMKKYGIMLESTDDLFVQPAETFDAITLWHVLEHVHELHAYLQTFYKILKTGGILIIAVPNYTSFDAAYYKENWAAYDVPRHLYHFSPQSMTELLSLHNFTIQSMKPMPFDGFYVSLLSEKYRHGKHNYANAFFTGLRSNFLAAGKPERSSSVIYIAKKI